jgi:subtilase family serine protease
MRTGTRIGRFLAVAFALLALSALMLTPAYAQTAKATSLGLESPSKVMNVHVMLNLHNKAALDALVKGLHDKSSPNYKQFLTKAQFAAQFAPTAAEAQKVANYLTASGLTVTHIDSHNMAVSASGSVAVLQKVFNTQIAKMQLNGQIFDMPTSTPAVGSSVASLVRNVSGLQTLRAKSYAAPQVRIDPKTKKVVPVTPVKYTKSKPNGLFFPGDCFSSHNDVLNLVGSGLQGIYSGNQYPDPGCGHSPAEVQHAYGFDTVIAGGIDGTGQIITIVDPYGSATILSDANTFSSTYGLPPLIYGTNFLEIDNPEGGTPDCVSGYLSPCGWEIETTLDVEWAHSMAPGAAIILVVPATNQFADLWEADLWIAENLPLGPVSHSFGAPESEVYFFDFPDYDDQYTVNEIADAEGYAYNYSSDDNGDFYGAGVLVPTDVSFPAGSPNATSVGGTSLVTASNGSYAFEEGWGTNITLIYYAPPFNDNFYFGAGGGTSQVTAAPTWQMNFLNNTWRMQPDVALNADPFTGAEIIYTDYWDYNPGETFVAVYGGTSLSCPSFSGVWALVEQKAGSPDSGNAAPILYLENALFPGSFNDVVPVVPASYLQGHNAHGTIFYNGIPTNYSQWDLAGTIQNTPIYGFYESIWNAQEITVTFGTDSSLVTAPGWDNVTGVGTPNGAAFIAPY